MGRTPIFQFYYYRSEMSFKSKKGTCYSIGLLTFALTATLLTTGTIFGWANMVVVFKDERFFVHLCPSSPNSNETEQKSNFSMESGHQQHPSASLLFHCSNQEKILNLVFTISVHCFGVVMLPGSTFPLGDQFAQTCVRNTMETHFSQCFHSVSHTCLSELVSGYECAARHIVIMQ